MDILISILGLTFGMALIVGVVTNKTNFCTMGAVSDLVNMGDGSRMRAWFLAIATAIFGVAILNGTLVDVSLTAQGSTGKPPYLTSFFVWPRYVLGGILFGIGMTLASGCGNKTLVRIGGGNLKSVVVFLVMGAAAYVMIYTDFSYFVFLQWMQAISFDFGRYGVETQGLDAIANAVTGAESSRLVIALIIVAAVLIWAFKSKEFRSDGNHISAGLIIGIAIVFGWYLTSGPMGQHLLEEVEFMDTRPYDVGAQSLTFVKPTAHFYYWISNGFALDFVTFALVATAGVIIGSLVYALFSHTFRVEWFYSWTDFINHCIGGLLMGVGGVLSLGCTFGQALSGASTLALGSFLTVASIIAGAAVTMKVQYALMMRE